MAYFKHQRQVEPVWSDGTKGNISIEKNQNYCKARPDSNFSNGVRQGIRPPDSLPSNLIHLLTFQEKVRFGPLTTH